MNKARLLFAVGLFLGYYFPAFSQRVYAPHSVLASGNWYKLGVKTAGLYRIDIPYLSNMGINTSNLASASIRVFGNGGQMLAESNAGPWTDDLRETALMVIDGGDGILNGSDYLLFYASGPDEWVNDAPNSWFSHRKNLYSDQSFYFLSVGGTGKRIADAPLQGAPQVTATSFSARYFHELDTVNFLSGSKEWYGEEMSSLPGRSLTRRFVVPFSNLMPNAPVVVQSNLVARSVGTASRFDIRVNNQLVNQLSINSTAGGPYDLFAQSGNAVGNSTSTQNDIDISYTYIPGSFNAQGWLNWFEIFTRGTISLNGINQLLFRDWQTVGNAAVEFVVANAGSSTQVWDITNPNDPLRMQGQLAGTAYRFVNGASTLHEYIAFNATGFLTPLSFGKIANQDLHNVAAAEMLLITPANFLSQAQRLAELHRVQDGLRVKIVTTAEVFNEFASGSPDPVSIRDFVKMYYDKFGTDPVNKPKYLLLFGDASFDYKDRLANNTNLVPGYQNSAALDPLSSYTSDDFFGFLDDFEDINSGLVNNLLDIGIGRIPASNIDQAKNFVDKLSAYFLPAAMGPWRNNFVFVADDEDNNLHLQDAEIIAATANAAAPLFNQQKIYLDAYRQESGAGGSAYPQAVQASNNQLLNGTLIWNYNGHGGANRLAEETILDQSMVNNWDNHNKLPLFITATCDFAPYDNPTIRSLGEDILLRARTGAIALLTTTRVVFAFSNRLINNNYLQFALQADASGKYRTLGDALKDAKNFTYQSSADITNNRKFTLLGDPALTLAFPRLRMRVTKVNGIPIATMDTLSATEKVTIEAEVTDVAGNLLTDFNGTAYPNVFDKAQTITTLANDPGSQPANFQSQTNALFKGRVSVANGRFSFSFKVPKDINFQYGQGRISLYADDAARDANGLFTNVIVGGIASDTGSDTEGPDIKPYLNDQLFANGGVVDQRPVLLVKLADSSGINTVGTGIGHDIVATLDGDNRQYFILNDFYQATINSYQEGQVRFQLPELSPGPHTLRIKAWDVLNNSNEAELQFTVAKDEELALAHVLNYPNPFTTHTGFWFEHNKPGQFLQVQVQIMTITGRVVKTISRIVLTEGNRSAEIEWDGRDDYGDKLGRGVYLYKLRVTAPDKKKKEVIEKLVIL